MAIQEKDSRVGEGCHAAFLCGFGGEPRSVVEHSRVVAHGARRCAFDPYPVQRGARSASSSPGWPKPRAMLTGLRLAWELRASCFFGSIVTNWSGYGDHPRWPEALLTRNSPPGSAPSVRRLFPPVVALHARTPSRETRSAVRKRSPGAWPEGAGRFHQLWRAAGRGRF
jgi:hypothetical protein